MNLQEFRSKNPQYKDWSDSRLITAIQKKHAAENIPDPQDSKSKGWSSVGRDVEKSLTSLPSTAEAILTGLPNQVAQSLKQVVTDPSRAYANIGAGVGEGVVGALNIPSNLSAYLSKKGIVSPETNKMMQKINIGDTGFEKAIGLGDEQEGDALLRGLGSFAPYARIGKAAEGIEALTKRGGATAAWATGQNQDPLQAGILGFLTEAGVKGAGNIPNLIPSKLLRGNLTPEQLAANLRATAGTETGLGDVLQNPKLKQFIENQAASFPYSGADEAMQNTATEIQARSNNLVDSLLNGTAPEDIGQTLVDALTKASTDATNIKNKKWSLVNNLAEKHDVQTDRSGLRVAAKNALERIKSDPDLAAFQNANDVGLLQKLAKLDVPDVQKSSIISAVTNKPFEFKTDKPLFDLKETEFLKSELGERAYDAYVNNDKPKANLYGDLKKALENDINSAIDDSGIAELKDARDDALDYHRNEFADFEDPDIMRFTRRKADPDTVVQYFLRTGRLTDRGNLLQKIQSKLNSEHKGILPYAYFSNALQEGNINPNKLRTLYNALGEKQKNILFPNNAQRRAFEDHNNLVGKNQEALSIMANPKTGFRIGNALQNAIQLATAAMGGSVGHIPGAILGGALGHFAPGFAYRPAVKLLTNPNFRESLVNKMLEREPRRNIPREQAIQGLIRNAGQDSRAITLPLARYLNQNQDQGSSNGY